MKMSKSCSAFFELNGLFTDFHFLISIPSETNGHLRWRCQYFWTSTQMIEFPFATHLVLCIRHCAFRFNYNDTSSLPS